MMKEADFQPPEFDRTAGRPLKSTELRTTSLSSGDSASNMSLVAIFSLFSLSSVVGV